MVIGRLRSGAIVWGSTLPHLQHLDLESHFHATPFKHYWMTPDGAIRSEKVSEKTRPSNRAIYHASQFGGQGGHSRASKPFKPRKGRKKARKPSRTLTFDWMDSNDWADLTSWEFDPRIDAWVKRR